MKDIIQISLLVLGLGLLVYFSFFYKKNNENFVSKIFNKNEKKEVLIEDFGGKHDESNRQKYQQQERLNIDTEHYSITEQYDEPPRRVQKRQPPQRQPPQRQLSPENSPEETHQKFERVKSEKENIFEKKDNKIKNLVHNLVDINEDQDDDLNEGYMSEVQMAPFSEVKPDVDSEAKEDFNVDLANENFIKANYFKGKKDGYVFKKGKKGLGYYQDTYDGNLRNSP